jgi:hypothetical protein
MFKEAEQKNAFVSVIYTCRNLVWGFYKKNVCVKTSKTEKAKKKLKVKKQAGC